jgi:hypothetical protein
MFDFECAKPIMSGMELQAALVDRGFRIPTIFVAAFLDE